MITIFNRKEVCTTYSMKVQSDVASALRARGIPYHIKTVSRGSLDGIGRSSVRAAVGSAGETPAYMTQYIIFVKKQDYEKCLGTVQKAVHSDAGR